MSNNRVYVIDQDTGNKVQRIEMTIDGVTYKRLNDAALTLGVKYHTLRDQIFRGAVKEGSVVNGQRVEDIELLTRKEYNRRYEEERKKGRGDERLARPIEYWMELDKFWWEKRSV